MNTKVQAEIERREAEFNAASPSEKRVLIAKDVLKQLDAGYIYPNRGKICNFSEVFLKGKSESDEVREVFLRESGAFTGASCACCAVGAMFLSCVLYRNELTIQKYNELISQNDNYTIPLLFTKIQTHSPLNGLTEYFSAKQIKLIEIAFEKGGGLFQDDAYEDLTEEEVERAVGYRDLFNEDDDATILRAIMNNIIKNNGEFVL